MLECDYEVKQIDGDYAHLQRIDRPEEELKLVARALLPMEIYEVPEPHKRFFPDPTPTVL